MGYAIELALKALCVQRDPSLIPGAGKIRSFDHDLVKLAGLADFSLGSGDRELLERARAYIEWGRYLTTRAPSTYTEPFEELDRPFHPDTALRLEDGMTPLEALLRRVHDEHAARARD